MSTLVKEAVSWMRMGMPLQLLKIVMFSPTGKVLKRDEASAAHFSKMKKIVEQKNEAVMFKVKFSSVTHLDFKNFKVLNFGVYGSLNF